MLATSLEAWLQKPSLTNRWSSRGPGSINEYGHKIKKVEKLKDSGQREIDRERCSRDCKDRRIAWEERGASEV